LKPPPVTAAPVPGQGAAPNAGAAAAGNGTGAGGNGTGTGAGGEGNGDGGGGGTSAELVSARIKESDTPQDIRNARFKVTTRSLVLIDAKGGFRDCRQLGSSGNANLDALVCRLIRERFRFRPARDGAGQAMAGQIIYEHDWEDGSGSDNDPPH
jgi:protein TonB